MIQKEATTNLEKREIKIRKWLLYFTLFAAAAVIIGDLVALVYNFLGGDLSGRFILKMVTVFFIASAVFSYYLWNLKRETMASRDPRMRWFIFGTLTLVAVATVYGFFVAGSPFAERMRRFDARRVQDLQSIQWQVINYWQRKDKLPAKLDDLRDEISGFVPPRDPEAGAAYEHRALGNLTFELCATFKTDSSLTSEPSSKPPPVAPPFGLGDNWAHGIGRVCFERTIDPELYGLDKPARPR